MCERKLRIVGAKDGLTRALTTKNIMVKMKMTMEEEYLAMTLIKKHLAILHTHVGPTPPGSISKRLITNSRVLMGEL